LDIEQNYQSGMRPLDMYQQCCSIQGVRKKILVGMLKIQLKLNKLIS